MMDRIKENLKKHYKLLIYMASTIGLCWIGVWRSIGTGAQWALAINCTGLCIFPMTVSRIDIKSLKKMPYIIWSAIFAVCAYPIYLYFKPGTDYDASVAMAILNIWLYGLVAIWLLTNVSKIFSGVKGRFSVFFFVWLVFSAFAIISINEAFWPAWFLVMMGGFYLAPLGKKDLDEMMLGITDGILVSFFWIQGRAFLYRTYDGNPRYVGHFNNVNITAMFFLVAYVAWLARLGYARRREKINKLECVICFIFASSMWDFVLLTLSRSSILAFVIITVIYLVLEEMVTFKKGIKGFLCRGLLLFLVFGVMFLPVFACCRYIPAFRHHPVWYGDYSEERVHSWDPVDSEKYTTLEQFVYKMIGKSVRTIQTIDEDFAEGTVIDQMSDKRTIPETPFETEIVSDFVNESPKATIVTDSVVEAYSDGVEPGSDSAHPYIATYSGNLPGQGIMSGRTYIYKYFIERLNVMGHKEAFPSVYLSSCEFYGHTHNSFLQIAYCFGIPAGILFIILIICAQIKIMYEAVKSKTGLSWAKLLPLLLLGAFTINGLFEMTALLGKFMFIGAFISLVVVIRRTD